MLPTRSSRQRRIHRWVCPLLKKIFLYKNDVPNYHSVPFWAKWLRTQLCASSRSSFISTLDHHQSGCKLGCRTEMVLAALVDYLCLPEFIFSLWYSKPVANVRLILWGSIGNNPIPLYIKPLWQIMSLSVFNILMTPHFISLSKSPEDPQWLHGCCSWMRVNKLKWLSNKTEVILFGEVEILKDTVLPIFYSPFYPHSNPVTFLA